MDGICLVVEKMQKTKQILFVIQKFLLATVGTVSYYICLKSVESEALPK